MGQVLAPGDRVTWLGGSRHNEFGTVQQVDSAGAVVQWDDGTSGWYDNTELRKDA